MRVCLVAQRFYERNTHMMQFAKAFSERDDTVDVVGIGEVGSPASEVIDGVNVFRIQQRTIDERGPLDYLLKMLCFLFRATWFLARRHIRQPYDVIHVQSVPDFLVFAALIPKLLGAKVILDLRDLVSELYASKFGVSDTFIVIRLLKLVEKLSARFADHVIVANPIWLEKITQRSAPAAKCSMYWYYPDRRLFHPLPRSVEDRKFRMIYPGSLNWHQGVDIAIKALPAILRAIPEAELHVQGEGPAKPELICLTKELGLQSRVVFHGYVPADTLVQQLADCDVGIVPKRGDRFGDEAASTKIPEFMAMGIPVVASRTSIELRFFDAAAIRYFQPENEAELAAAVISVRQDDALRARMIAKGLAYTQENAWQQKIQMYLDLVMSLSQDGLGGSTKGRAAKTVPARF